MRKLLPQIFLFLLCITSIQAQRVEDDFEGSGTISSWFGDDCTITTGFDNPFQMGINTSKNVLQYDDTGGTYANVRFDVEANFNLATNHTFTLKIYVPSNGITGTQNNQVSLKLQNNTLNEPWTTQTEIIKDIVLDQWQELTFDFKNDNFINFNQASAAPTTRTDFNRVLIQVNGENNTDKVLAYIDDVAYDGTIEVVNFDNLVWSDEFNGSGAINTANWHHQTILPVGYPNGTSWYNNEIQHYTNRTDNSYESGGSLHIVAKKEEFIDQGVQKQYTSARLNSKFAFTYGKVELRAKLPTGVGTWPAIWMLGKNITEPGGYWTSSYGTTPWPDCGEIDIMEHWGNNQDYVQSAMHTRSSHGGTVNKGGRYIENASSEFHIYTLEWTAEKMVFKVDGTIHYTYNPPIKDTTTWPFDTDQYILLNVAIQQDIDPSFTQSEMEIDYVRVYQQSALSVSDELTKDAVVVYPNPTNQRITLQVPQDFVGYKATVFTVLGQRLDSFELTSTHTSKDFSTYPKGIYLIRVQTPQNSFTYKVFKN